MTASAYFLCFRKHDIRTLLSVERQRHMALYSRGSLVVFSLFSSLSFGKEGKGKVVKHRLLKLNLLCLTRQHFLSPLAHGRF